MRPAIVLLAITVFLSPFAASAADRLPDSDIAAGLVNLGRIHQIAFGLMYHLNAKGNLDIGTTQHERAVALGLRDEELVDPWGTQYRVDVEVYRFRVIGAGIDRKFSPDEKELKGWTFSLGADVVNENGTMIRQNYEYLVRMLGTRPQTGLYEIPTFTSVDQREPDAPLTSVDSAMRFESASDFPLTWMKSEIDPIRAEKTLAAMQLLSARIAAFELKHDSLAPLRVKNFVDVLRREPWDFNDWLSDRDEWGTPFGLEIAKNNTAYRLASAGSDRRFGPRPAATTDVDQIVENGTVVQQFDRKSYETELRARLKREEEQKREGSAAMAGGSRSAPYRVGGAVKAPVILYRIDPVYPEEIRKERIGGVCIIEATIDETGHVENVRPLVAPNHELEQAAIDAVRQWTFQPGTLDGKPVPVLFNLTVNFVLN